MALDNITVEPRRELTEILIGLFVVAVPVAADGYVSHLLALSWSSHDKHMPYCGALILGLLGVTFAAVMAIVVLSGLLLLVHAIGQDICDSLEKRGWQLRPKQRWIRHWNGSIVRQG